MHTATTELNAACVSTRTVSLVQGRAGQIEGELRDEADEQSRVKSSQVKSSRFELSRVESSQSNSDD